MDEYLTTAQAAKELGYKSANTIRVYIRRKLITPVERNGWQTYFTRAEIERFKVERRKVGNPGTPRK